VKVTVADVGAALPMYRVLDCIRDEHDYRLVLLAVAICAVTSWTAWYLYAMSATARGLSRLAWILQTAVAAGSGIWATHFIAMLAFKSAIPTTYDSLLTLTSLLIAILVTGAGFCVAEITHSKWSWISAGLAIGSGIAMMHYSGMNAMSIAGHIRWDPILVIASIALGMLFAAFAMWSFKENGSRLFAAGLLTAAICILHFTAMGAATVEYDPTVVTNTPQVDNELLATAIAGVILLVILSGLAAALINRDTVRALRHLADHDHLTGLPNRGYISRMIEHSITSGAKSGFALLFVDLDRFKGINDGHGHVVGDYVLRQAAQRLRRAVCDTAIVARAGGDEFIVMVAGSEPTMAKRLADAIVSSFHQPFDIPGGCGKSLGVSVGVAFFPRDGHDGESLLRAADGALYRVKRTGGAAVALAA
jgi:diguanylate cyclase (GGDEF)-like protein